MHFFDAHVLKVQICYFFTLVSRGYFLTWLKLQKNPYKLARNEVCPYRNWTILPSLLKVCSLSKFFDLQFVIRFMLISQYWRNTMHLARTYWGMPSESWKIVGQYHPDPRRPQGNGERWYWPTILKDEDGIPQYVWPRCMAFTLLLSKLKPHIQFISINNWVNMSLGRF